VYVAANNLFLPGLFVALGAGVVVTTYLMIAPGSRPTSASAAKDSAALAADGVRPADHDSARQLAADGEVDADPANPRLPTVAPERTAEARTRPEAPPPEPPPPPVELTAEQKAAQDAYFALRDRTAGEVANVLGQQKDALRKACWKPSLTNGLTSAMFALNASFDAEGKLLATAISDSRDAGGASAGAVGECLRSQALKLDIPAPGQGVTVDVALSLP
jgi:hypothetical protein